MNQITKVKNWIILFKDKSVKYITEQEAEKIYFNAKGNSEFFFMDGRGYSFKIVAKIISLQEYYEEYPDLRPAPTALMNNENVRHGEYPFKYLPKTPVDRKNALKKMIEGISKFISNSENEGNNPLKAKELRKKMELKLETICN